MTSTPSVRSLYREPSQGAIDKVVGSIGPAAADFLALSPLFVIASTDGAEVDASPRGGPPGFVKLLDDRTLVFGDLTGNNRLDTYTNMEAVASVGCIFFLPGSEETVRINGRAEITTDEELRRLSAIGERLPKVAVKIHVTECYLHCGAALRRANLWDTATWPAEDDRPTGGQILKEAIDAPIPAEEIDAGLASYYDNGVWEVGGADPE